MLELFLIPAVQGDNMVLGPSINGAYTANTENEISIAFGVTKLSTEKWNSIVSKYDVKLSVGTDSDNMANFTFTEKGIESDTNPEYVIVGSYKDANTIQNATRIRFLVDGGLIEEKDSNTIIAKMQATHRATGKTIKLEISVINNN